MAFGLERTDKEHGMGKVTLTEYHRLWRKKNPDKWHKANQKAWHSYYERHRERIIARKVELAKIAQRKKQIKEMGWVK